MRTFFGHLACECDSVRLVCYAVTTPDAVMEVSGHQIVCLDCVWTFHDAVDVPAESPPVQQTTAESSDHHAPSLAQDRLGKDDKVSMEHGKGMEALVSEAIKFAQYQRMTHNGIPGFGSVAAFAKALKLDNDNKKLGAAVKDMYVTDELMSELAEAAVDDVAVDE